VASVSERLVSEELVELLVAMLRFVILLFVFDSVSSACKLSLLVRPWNSLPVSVKWLAVKTASEMTYTVSGGALNSTQTKPNLEQVWSLAVNMSDIAALYIEHACALVVFYTCFYSYCILCTIT